MLPTRDTALTLAGGGNRALYQMGLLRQWGDRLRPRLAAVAACSGGACVGTIWLSGRNRVTQRFWRNRVASIRSNVQWSSLLRGGWPTPHPQLYRDLLLYALAEGGLERIRRAPFPVLVVATAPPRSLPLGLGTAVGVAAYALEHTFVPGTIHPRLGPRLGFSPHVVDVRQCETAEQLAQVVEASSAIPPFTRVRRLDGRRLLDGGLFDNAPAVVAERVTDVRRNLVLLTKPYPTARVGVQGSRLYVAPTRPTPVEALDCTTPDRLEQTIALGQADAHHYAPQLRHLLLGSRPAATPPPGPRPTVQGSR